MGLVLLRKGSQCFIGPVFTPFAPPTCVINSQKKTGAATPPASLGNVDDGHLN